MNVVNFEVHQPDNLNEDAPTLVLIHGLFGSLDNLAVMRRHFEKDYRVISIDLPDHGKSYRSQTFSFDAYATAILDQLVKLNVTRLVLVGHSLGGKVSMVIASRAPDLIEQLVIMDIAPVQYDPRHENVIAGLTSVDLTSIGSRKDAHRELSKHIHDNGTQSFLLKSLYQDENRQWHWRFNLDLVINDYPKLSDWPYSDVMYTGDTLFIKGSQSDYILAEHQPKIVHQFPNATAKVVNAGHWLHSQKPQTVNALLTKYLPIYSN
ncbi:MAG: alpha/beta fold hydrolase [Pseudomonadota bacterium]